MNLPIPSISPITQDRIRRPFIQGFSGEAVECATTDRAFAGPNLSKWFEHKESWGLEIDVIVSEMVYTLIRFEQWFVGTGLLNEPLHPESDLSIRL